LAPFEECTREVRSEAALISVIIPLVAILRNILSRSSNNAGVKTLKASLLESLNKHFATIQEDNPLDLNALWSYRHCAQQYNMACHNVSTLAKERVIQANNLGVFYKYVNQHI